MRNKLEGRNTQNEPKSQKPICGMEKILHYHFILPVPQLKWPYLSPEYIATPWGEWKRHKRKLTVSVFMPSPTLWQSRNTTALLSSRHFPFRLSDCETPAAKTFASRRGRGRLTRRYLDTASNVTSKNKASCQTSRGHPGPQSKGADRKAICKGSFEVAPDGPQAASEPSSGAAMAPANKLKWKASSGTVWESRVNPCQLL